MRNVRLLVGLLALFACAAQDRADPVITRSQADEMLSELRGIRLLLEKLTNRAEPAPPAPQIGKLKLDGGFALGSADAPVTVVEFTDYQCPFCRRFQSATLGEIRKRYIDTGKVRLVVRDFPLSFHADAMRAAEAARCAGDQGKFWQMHGALFSDPAKLGPQDLIEDAESLQLDVGVFRSCLESERHRPGIQSDMQAASSLQIKGTPSFLIGKTTGDEVAGSIVVGAQPLSAFEANLKEAGALP